MGFAYSVNEKFFDEWNEDMAYMLGYLYADGSVHESSRGKYVSVTSIDKVTIQCFKELLNAGNPIYEYAPNGIGRKIRYCLRIGNKHMYESLLAKGLYPSKSLTVRMPMVPKKYLADFVRGYFDGDGCVYLYRTEGKKGTLILRKLSAIFTSGSKEFLEDLLAELRESIELRQTKIYRSHSAYQLRFATKDTVVLFRFMYRENLAGLYLKRKYAIFQQYFELKRAQW